MQSPMLPRLATRRAVLRAGLGLGCAALASGLGARPTEAASLESDPLAPAAAPFDLGLAEFSTHHVSHVSHPTPPPAPPRLSAPTSRATSVTALAARLVGTPYVWGGTSPRGFDCSGFVWYVYREAGRALPRDLQGQFASARRTSLASLLPGDLVFFANTYEAGLSHVGIYLGGGRFVHAQDYGIGVTVTSLANPYWAAHLWAANRPLA